MTDKQKILQIIEYSCLPLLCGNRSAVYQTARRLFRLYGLKSYALLTEDKHHLSGLLSRFFVPHCVRPIQTACRTPLLLADVICCFFEIHGSPGTLPVLIDCTEDTVLLSDPAIRECLEAHCFATTSEQAESIPPLCYLYEGDTSHD